MLKLFALLAVSATLRVTVVSAVLPDDYQLLPGAEKQALLWDQINRDAYTVFPVGGRPQSEMMNVFNPAYHTHTFNTISDEMPEGRTKILHPYGSCVTINLEIDATSPYTGVFKAGAVVPGIARPSVATWNPAVLTPGMGVKLLIDGRPSENIMSIFHPAGQGGDRNFMANKISNFFVAGEASGTGALIVQALEAALTLLPGSTEDRPVSSNNIAVYEPAAVEADGQVVPTGGVVAPFKIVFVPNPDNSVPADSTADFREQLSNILSGNVLYTVRAFRSEEETGEGELIGRLVTTSDFVASPYCDETLFMQHSRKSHKAN